MIRSFLAYHQKYENSELHIVGKGAFGEVLKKKYESYGSVFRWTKYGDDLLNVYRQNHVLILPSTYMNLGDWLLTRLWQRVCQC